jgi:two-component system, NtrC family, sensor histidine kinase HydH
MPFKFGARWQAALVVLLFMASLAALCVSSVMAFWLPGEELRVRDQIGAAAGRVAEAGAPVLEESWPAGGDVPPPLQRRLSAVAQAALANQPDAEAGFYLAGDSDFFVGATAPPGPPPPPQGRRPPPDDHKRPPPPPGRDGPHGPPPRHDPPPLEGPYICQQARDSLNRPPEMGPLIQTFDVGPSRVVVATMPVGSQRPARAVGWVMVRLFGPAQLQARLGRTQMATGLALAGILLSLVLTLNLAWTLRRERARREKLSDDLRRSEHLASLGRLLAGVAHEVRNPLAGIRSTVQLWQRLPEQTRTPQSLDAVIGAVDRLNGLVGRLLYFARTGCDAPQPVDVNAVVRETLELMRAQAAGQGVHMEADLDEGLPPVAGSQPALQQVVLNLATNALQAMPKGGRLDMQTRTVDDPRGVELRVTDTGPGVPPEARPHLFEPFFTTRPEGTGLGLALCREIVRQHGGEIGLENAVLPGAVFRVRLPAADPSKGKSS